MLADAIVKGLNLTAEERMSAFRAAKKDAEVDPASWFLEGRGGLAHWKKIGYIPVESNAPSVF